MGEDHSQLIEFLKIISDETRLNILVQLREDDKTSKQLEKLLDKTQSTISHQLNTLIKNNLIDYEVREINKKAINYYKLKNNDIFNLLSKINSFIEKINTDNFLERRKKDLYDILT